MAEAVYDAVVVGGGPAGLSAALQLGRARVRTLVLDAGSPRNERAAQVNGVLTRDGTAPADFRAAARNDLAKYDCLEIRRARASEVKPRDDGFSVVADDGSTVSARRVLLATGVLDVLPSIPGIEQFWGTSVVQCPFCHGWELAEGPLALLALDPEEVDSAHLYRVWSEDVTILTGGMCDVPDETRELAEQAGFEIYCEPVAELRGIDGRLECVVLEGGHEVACRGMFVHNQQHPTDLVEGLGLETDDGFVVVRKDYQMPDDDGSLMQTSVPGLYAAGDLTGDSQDATMAIFEGTMAGRAMFFASLAGRRGR